jgi:hypothetical protein
LLRNFLIRVQFSLHVGYIPNTSERMAATMRVATITIRTCCRVLASY